MQHFQKDYNIQFKQIFNSKGYNILFSNPVVKFGEEIRKNFLGGYLPCINHFKPKKGSKPPV